VEGFIYKSEEPHGRVQAAETAEPEIHQLRAVRRRISGGRGCGENDLASPRAVPDPGSAVNARLVDAVDCIRRAMQANANWQASDAVPVLRLQGGLDFKGAPERFAASKNRACAVSGPIADEAAVSSDAFEDDLIMTLKGALHFIARLFQLLSAAVDIGEEKRRRRAPEAGSSARFLLPENVLGRSRRRERVGRLIVHGSWAAG
jgi:hypothetical protein